jgi:3-methyl-2-oxobutanoate hydroxymethyltransferase
MAGLTPSVPKFAKRYADVAGMLGQAASDFAAEVASGAYPTSEYCYR